MTEAQLTVISGIVKSVSEDRKEITVTAQEYVKAAKEGERGSFEEKDVVLRAPVPVEDLQAGDLATATGFKAGAGKINIDTISSQNSYIEAEGLGVLSGKVLFANVQTEIDRETGQPHLTQAGSPKKPHFDITVATGSGQDRVTHTVKIYNTKENDNIARYERLFANFDREKNATLQTRETIGGGMFDRGALTINEYRELMYYGPVEDGDQRLVSLNYVKVGDQSLYQVGQQNEPPDDTGANDREKRAMQAAARAYMQIMKGG